MAALQTTAGRLLAALQSGDGAAAANAAQWLAAKPQECRVLNPTAVWELIAAAHHAVASATFFHDAAERLSPKVPSASVAVARDILLALATWAAHLPLARQNQPLPQNLEAALEEAGAVALDILAPKHGPRSAPSALPRLPLALPAVTLLSALSGADERFALCLLSVLRGSPELRDLLAMHPCAASEALRALVLHLPVSHEGTPATAAAALEVASQWADSAPRAISDAFEAVALVPPLGEKLSGVCQHVSGACSASSAGSAAERLSWRPAALAAAGLVRGMVARNDVVAAASMVPALVAACHQEAAEGDAAPFSAALAVAAAASAVAHIRGAVAPADLERLTLHLRTALLGRLLSEKQLPPPLLQLAPELTAGWAWLTAAGVATNAAAGAEANACIAATVALTERLAGIAWLATVQQHRPQAQLAYVNALWEATSAAALAFAEAAVAAAESFGTPYDPAALVRLLSYEVSGCASGPARQALDHLLRMAEAPQGGEAAYRILFAMPNASALVFSEQLRAPSDTFSEASAAAAWASLYATARGSGANDRGEGNASHNGACFRVRAAVYARCCEAWLGSVSHYVPEFAREQAIPFLLACLRLPAGLSGAGVSPSDVAANVSAHAAIWQLLSRQDSLGPELGLAGDKSESGHGELRKRLACRYFQAALASFPAVTRSANVATAVGLVLGNIAAQDPSFQGAALFCLSCLRDRATDLWVAAAAAGAAVGQPAAAAAAAAATPSKELTALLFQALRVAPPALLQPLMDLCSAFVQQNTRHEGSGGAVVLNLLFDAISIGLEPGRRALLAEWYLAVANNVADMLQAGAAVGAFGAGALASLQPTPAKRGGKRVTILGGGQNASL